MNVDRIMQAATALTFASSAAGVLAVTRGRTGSDDPVPDVLGIGGAVAVAAAATTVAGLAAARWGEHTLRSGVVRGGRGAALLGAATLGGAALGAVASLAAGRLAVTRRTNDHRSALEDERARGSELDAQVEHLSERAEGVRALVDEARPATPMRDIVDGRVDLIGAPIGPAAKHLFNAYDRHDNGLWLGDQQRTVGDRTFTIAPIVMAELGERIQSSPRTLVELGAPDVEEIVFREVDSTRSGSTGVIDPDEADSWYDDIDSIGEKDITWRWSELLDELGADERILGSGHVWRLEPFSDEVPLLALVGVDSVDEARTFAQHAAAVTPAAAYAVVELPADAPCRYALASVAFPESSPDERATNAERSEVGESDERIVAVVSAAGSRLDPETGDWA